MALDPLEAEVVAVSLDDKVVTVEQWPTAGWSTTVPELLEEVRRAHDQIDAVYASANAWMLCAAQWKERCERFEARCGEAEQRLSVAVAVLEESVEARGAQAAGRP